MAGAPKVYPLLKRPEFQPESASERLALAPGSLVGREKHFPGDGESFSAFRYHYQSEVRFCRQSVNFHMKAAHTATPDTEAPFLPGMEGASVWYEGPNIW